MTPRRGNLSRNITVSIPRCYKRTTHQGVELHSSIYVDNYKVYCCLLRILYINTNKMYITKPPSVQAINMKSYFGTPSREAKNVVTEVPRKGMIAMFRNWQACMCL
jgi:hypothetical protein